MPTRRGWALLGGAVVLVVLGRLLGLQELYVLGAAAVALVVIGLSHVRIRPVHLVARRELHPSRVHAGSDSRVELAVRNAGERRTPVLSVRDPFDQGRRQARFFLAPLGPGETARAAYRLPTDRRGVYDLGPLDVLRTDPFGLAAVRLPGAPVTQLTVYPRIEQVVAVPHTVGHDPYAGADHPNALGRGDDFYGLRPYEVGDDLRRVHWPSTARTDELMIRQDEMPWQGRVTVVLDARHRAHSAESFEAAVSAAASVVAAGWRRRSLVRLVTSGGSDSGFANGVAHVEAIMEHLATVELGRDDHLGDVLAVLHRSGNGGGLVAVTATPTDGDVEALARLRSRFGLVTLVRFAPSSYDLGLAGDTRLDGVKSVPGINLVHVSAKVPFVTAWNAAMLRGRRSAAGAAR